MNKRITLKLLLLLSLSLISCGQKDNISKSNSNKYNNETQNSIKKEENNVNQDTNSPELFIVAGGRNKVPGICEYSLHEINVTSRIIPSVITENSSYYDVKNPGSIYIDIILDVYSLSNEAKMTDDIITSKIKINNNEYSCFSLLESSDGSDLKKYGSIKPLETRNIHYVAEVPIADSTGELEIILTINGRDFSNKFQLDNSNTQPEVTQVLTEEEYYIIIKEAKQRQQDYIDSIDDPKVKQSVQTPYAAAIAESTALYIKYPGDTYTIDAALKKVLNGE